LLADRGKSTQNVGRIAREAIKAILCGINQQSIKKYEGSDQQERKKESSNIEGVNNSL
jgi:rRNA processing protein Krr1/Pno1